MRVLVYACVESYITCNVRCQCGDANENMSGFQKHVTAQSQIASSWHYEPLLMHCHASCV